MCPDPAHVSSERHSPAAAGLKPLVRSSGPGRASIGQRLAGQGAPAHAVLPFFTVILLVLVAFATAHLVDMERSRAEDAARAATAEMADVYMAQVRHTLGTIDTALKSVKYAVSLKGQDGALRALNQQGLTPSGLIFTIHIVDKNGVVVASNSGSEQADVAEQAHFRYHRSENNKVTFVSRVQRGNSPGEWILCFSRRLNDASGNFDGIVIAAVDPAYLTGSQDYPRLGKLGAIGVFGEDGTFRALRIGAADNVSWGQGAPSKVGSVTPGKDIAGPAPSSWDGVQRYVSVRPIPGMPLTGYVGLAEPELMAGFAAQRRNTLWIAIGGSAGLVVIVGLVCAWSRQITRQRQRTRRAEQTFAAASMASLDAFFVLRSVQDRQRCLLDFAIEETNARAQDLVGQAAASLRGKHLTDVLPCCRTNGVLHDLARVTAAGGVHESEWECEITPGRRKWLHQQVVAVDDGVVAIVRDITERKANEAAIRYQAHHDQLTGLPNRAHVRDRLEHAIAQASRSTRAVTLVFIDLDGFKHVNDTLGHGAGDELLKIVAARMSGCLRRDDTLGRFGGDEFIIVFGDQDDDLTHRKQLLERIRDRVNEPIELDGRPVQVGCSMGVAVYPRDGLDAAALMERADAAMYRAKQLGKNNVQVCDGS